MKNNNRYSKEIEELLKKVLEGKVMCSCCGKSVLNHKKKEK